MAALLGDDGTLDTVIYCNECGQEQRYNYDPPVDFADDPPEDWEECGQCSGHHPPGFTADCRDDVNRWPSNKCIKHLEKESYNAFVEWCLEDFESEHECERNTE